MGIVGSIISPYFVQASENDGINTWIFPGLIGLVATAYLILLPETYGKPIED